ncbi:esterase/lipase family protein [Pseudoduganella dura]|nr:hypothetical protein [Pseudoduganella dura]
MKKGAQKNEILRPGEAAWRPPNGAAEGMNEVGVWKKREPAERQKILNGHTLEVDSSGAIEFEGHMTLGEVDEGYARSHGWGEIHWSSYGGLLIALKLQFGKFLQCGWESQPPTISSNWIGLNQYDRKLWRGVKSEILADFQLAEIENLAGYWYPIYAFGYNWLLSNENSADRLSQRIEQIISHYSSLGRECEKVMVVTHSMGGLVARACAKKIPEKIRGIIHVCMPALGAPVCYRRIACGTETFSPSNGKLENATADAFAEIAGRTSAETNAVMAHAPGALELLPTHLYPKPWLFIRQNDEENKSGLVERIPIENPYKFYRDVTTWYRLFQPELIDPANEHKEHAVKKMQQSVDQAAKFHEKILDIYYHPNSFAIYGSDSQHLSFGRYTWIEYGSQRVTPDILFLGKQISSTFNGHRSVEIKDGRNLLFTPSIQDEDGDGTVPATSGAGVLGGVKKTFMLSGFDHQNVFSNSSVMMLTFQLIARAILES